MEEARDNGMGLGESQGQEGGYSWKHKKDEKKVHFASLMDICHLLKMRSLNPICRSTKAESCSGET